MIIGIGTDIVQIPRIERILNLYGRQFINRILSQEEEQRLATINQQQYSYFLARRFAAKEAVSKAVGTGIGKYLQFKNISIINDDLGKPLVQIVTHKNLLKLEQIKIHLSLSDDYPISVAFAIATLI